MKTIMIITSQGQQAAGKPRGFAALSPERRKEVAHMGAVAAHQAGTAYRWDSEAARVAGARGGRAKRRRGGAN